MSYRVQTEKGATCSLCGRVPDYYNMQDYQQWFRLTRNSLEGTFQASPGYNFAGELNYYLCPECQKKVNLEFWKLFSKRQIIEIQEVAE